ncbi:extracellular matrix protein 1 isoform X1 [Scleropages formosus]|uniref:Extracellular matrix protein 1-like n=1 Tax=Scleropages formosus TaxID=113540 RepID=A0A8C9W0F9_SCLFO|nr:extracellular matrix protein 1 isoform X1 [Scleropages formosus]
MGSFPLRVLTLLLLLGCTASQDQAIVEQREVTFDLSDLFEHKEILETDPDMSQREVTFDLPTIPKRSFLGPPMFGPRSFSEPQVLFPPARPSMDNLPALCRYSDSRPRYPSDSFLVSGLDYLHRQGDAINRVESWYSTCCSENGIMENKTELTLCCARQAWEHALSQFCEEEFSIKTSHYQCCKIRGRERWNCFEGMAPNPTYEPSSQGTVNTQSPPEPGFTWNPNNCPSIRLQLNPKNFSEGTSTLNFPPGRPTSTNIDHACNLRKMRPRYPLKCLPQMGYNSLVRQIKTVNKLEKGIDKCCKGRTEVLTCVDRKWRKLMDQFCLNEQMVKTSQFPCCLYEDKEERYTCFAERSPNPEYTREIEQSEVFLLPNIIDVLCNKKRSSKKIHIQGVP